MVPIYTFNIVSTNVDTAPTLHEAHWRQMTQGNKNQQPKTSALTLMEFTVFENENRQTLVE